MRIEEIIKTIADILKKFDSERPTDQQKYRPGIGPFREVQLIKEVAKRLTKKRISDQEVVARTHRTPDMSIRTVEGSSESDSWAFEFKIVRPFGDNGDVAENWSQNLLHPYEGNVSLMGDAKKILGLSEFQKKGLIAICYEHGNPQIDIEPLLFSFELLSLSVMRIPLGRRVEEKRLGLVHPIHQVVRCVGWQLDDQNM